MISMNRNTERTKYNGMSCNGRGNNGVDLDTH